MASSDLTILRFIPEVTLGVTPNNGTKATAVLTVTGNMLNTETVTIDSKVYTFQTTLTNVDGNVKIAATAALTLANLRNAINRLPGAGVPGTDFAVAMTAHPTVICTATTATTLTLNSILTGTAGGSIATTETGTVMSWGAADMVGGTNSSITILEELRYTGESLNFNIENTQSAEIRSDRAEADLVQTAASAAGDINIELSFDSYKDFLEGALCNSFTAGTGDQLNLQNGTTLKSYTLQKHFTDMAIPQFHTFNACVVESMMLKMEIGKIIEGSFSFMSFGAAAASAQIAGATYTPAGTNTPMNAVTNVQSFTIDGVPYSGCISKLDLEIKNNVRALRCIGSLEAKSMQLGTIQISGSMEFYFNEGQNYAKFIAGTEFDFSFILQDIVGNQYIFTIPRAKFETGEVVAGGKNSDVMFSAKWRALYDSVTGRVIQIIADPV